MGEGLGGREVGRARKRERCSSERKKCAHASQAARERKGRMASIHPSRRILIDAPTLASALHGVAGQCAPLPIFQASS